ncbi:MmcQ/YjbR family DNA-binding protein [Rhodococcus kronopolitis]|uniref:MmcQ/YjbR family DNA-binding protein n=1 Tax=Rhodococcus kronopolitis TaxID=1460226 RepID=A0ABV9FQY9_9NOCA
MTATTPLDRLRGLCLALPEATERVSHGEPAWFVRRAPQFAMFADRHHDDRVAFWAAAPAGAQEDWIRRDSLRYFRPPYVGTRGWIGVFLDVRVDWDEVADIVEDAYRTVAPRNLVSRLDSGAQ